MDRTEIDVGPLHVPLVKDESKGHEGSSIIKKEKPKVKIRFFGESFILNGLRTWSSICHHISFPSMN